LRIWAGRVEIDSKRLFEARRKHFDLHGLAGIADSTKDPDIAQRGFGEKYIAIRSRTHQSWVVETGRVLLHFEAREKLRPRVLVARHDLRTVARGCCGEGGRQVLQRNLAA